MFKNLNAEMARENITIKGLSERTGIKYPSLKNKMSGNTGFTLKEMLAVKIVFPTCTMDYLFASDKT